MLQALPCFPHFQCFPSELLSQNTTRLRWKGVRTCKEQQSSSCNPEYCLQSFIVPDPSLGTKDPVGKSDMSFICDREKRKTREISRWGKLDSEKPFKMSYGRSLDGWISHASLRQRGFLIDMELVYQKSQAMWSKKKTRKNRRPGLGTRLERTPCGKEGCVVILSSLCASLPPAFPSNDVDVDASRAVGQRVGIIFSVSNKIKSGFGSQVFVGLW